MATVTELERTYLGNLLGLTPDQTAKKSIADLQQMGYALSGGGSSALPGISTDTTVVNTVAETDLGSLAIPTDVKVGGILHAAFVGEVLNNTAGSLTWSFRPYIGATLITLAQANLSLSVAHRQWRCDVDLYIISPTNDQRLSTTIVVNGPSAGNTIANQSFSGTARSTAAEDLTSQKNLKLSVQMNVADAQGSCTLHDAFWERFRP